MPLYEYRCVHCDHLFEQIMPLRAVTIRAVRIAASQLTAGIMQRLHDESQKSQKPITQLIREALEKEYKS